MEVSSDLQFFRDFEIFFGGYMLFYLDWIKRNKVVIVNRYNVIRICNVMFKIKIFKYIYKFILYFQGQKCYFFENFR